MSSVNVTDGERIPLPTIDLNMANLREQIAGAPPARFDDYTMDKTSLKESIIKSSVITSTSGQDNSQSYSRTQDDKQMNNTHPMFTTCSNTINGIACNSLPSEYYSDDKLRKTDNFGTTEHADFLLCIDEEIDTTSSEDESITSTAVTSVRQRYNNGLKYNYRNQGNGQTIYTRSKKKFTNCSNTTNDNPCNCDLGDYCSDDVVQITDNFGATKHTDLFQRSDDEMNNATTSASGSIESTVSSFSVQDNGSKYYWTENDKKTNDTRGSNFPTNNNMTDAIALNCGDPGEYNSVNGIKKPDCSGTNKQTKTGRDNVNINTASISANSAKSTVITSVRKQENGSFVYLTEYDEAMNETRSEVYTIGKPITTGLKEPLGTLIVIRYPYGFNIERTEQSSKSSEHVREPQIFGKNQNNKPSNNSTSDDETDTKM